MAVGPMNEVSDEAALHIPFSVPFHCLPQQCVGRNGLGLKGNLGYVCANKPGFVRFRGFPCSLAQQLMRSGVQGVSAGGSRRRSSSGTLEMRDKLIVCSAERFNGGIG